MKLYMYILFGLLFLTLRLEVGFCAVTPCNNVDIGENNPQSKNDNVDSNTGKGYMMQDSNFATILCCGVIDGWEVFVDNVAGTRTLWLQVWRSTGSGDNYELVGENSRSFTSKGEYPWSEGTGSQITIKANDKIGWWTSGTDLVTYKTGGGEEDDNWLLTIGDIAEGGSQDWNGKTVENDRTYAIRAFINANTDPSFTNVPGSQSILNTVGSGANLITVAVTDTNSYDVSTLAVTMTANSQFSFDTSTLILSTGTLTGAPSTEVLVFEVADQCENTATASYTVTITNDPPTIHSLPASISISEDTSVETSLHAINVTDSGATVTCSFATSMPASYPFLLKSDNTIYSQSTPGFDYDTATSYTLPVDCTDTYAIVSSTFTVNILQNSPPVIQNLQNSTSVSTTTTIGAVAFTVISTDAEGDTLTYTMTCTPSPCPFQLFASGSILVTEDLTNHTTVGYDLDITVADARGSDGPKTLTITITDINDPVILSNLPLGSSLSVSENTALATSIFTVSYSDNDASQTRVFSMTSSPTEGMTYFNIDSTSGLITTSGTVLNYESLGATSFTLSVTVSDGVASDTDSLVIDIVNENEAPVFSPTSYSISGNESSSGSTVGTPVFGITDPDSGDSYTFTMDCGASSSYFIMTSPSGEVRFQSDYDVDSGSLPSSVTCVVTATDNGGLQDNATLIINIDNINDNTPSFVPSSYIFYLSYYATVPTTLGATMATDGDAGTLGTLTFTLNQATLGAEYFAIDTSGLIVLQQQALGTSALNYTNSVVITAIATDGGGLTDTATVTIVVSDTTTTASTTTTNAYKTFVDDPSNLAWLVPCALLALILVAMLFYTAVTCHGDKGCTSFLRKMRGRKGFGKSRHRQVFFPELRNATSIEAARNAPPPVALQTWRRQMHD